MSSFWSVSQTASHSMNDSPYMLFAREVCVCRKLYGIFLYIILGLLEFVLVFLVIFWFGYLLVIKLFDKNWVERMCWMRGCRLCSHFYCYLFRLVTSWVQPIPRDIRIPNSRISRKARECVLKAGLDELFACYSFTAHHARCYRFITMSLNQTDSIWFWFYSSHK